MYPPSPPPPFRFVERDLVRAWHNSQRQDYGMPGKWKSKDVVGCLVDLDQAVARRQAEGEGGGSGEGAVVRGLESADPKPPRPQLPNVWCADF